jgi:hypothetical protein
MKITSEDIVALADCLADEFDLDSIRVADTIRDFLDENMNYNREHQAEQEELDNEQEDLTNSQM